MIAATMAIHGVPSSGGKMNNFTMNSKWTENELLGEKKQKQGHQTFIDRIDKLASKWAKYQNLEGWRQHLLQRRSQI